VFALSKSASFVFLVAACSLVACQNYKDQLQRGQGYYEQNQYEAALAVFRHLESDQSALNQDEVIRYCYLRGMTDFRLGFRQDARYWLGLAKSADNPEHSPLLEDELGRLNATLDELSREVYGINEAPETVESQQIPPGPDAATPDAATTDAASPEAASPEAASPDAASPDASSTAPDTGAALQ
jgi:hypothetical protein